jgi:hypothetical protein
MAGLESTSPKLGGGAEYVPDMANHEVYRAARDRQTRLEQTLVQSGEFV